MKKIIAIALMFFNCEPGEESISGSQSGLQPVLTIGESVKIGGNDGTSHFIVKVGAIEDRRCPMDAQCIRAGHATARIQIVSNDEISEVIDLCIGECVEQNTRAEFATGVGLWRVSLLSIDPPPRLNTPDIPKKASIILERIG